MINFLMIFVVCANLGTQAYANETITTKDEEVTITNEQRYSVIYSQESIDNGHFLTIVQGDRFKKFIKCETFEDFNVNTMTAKEMFELCQNQEQIGKHSTYTAHELKKVSESINKRHLVGKLGKAGASIFAGTVVSIGTMAAGSGIGALLLGGVGLMVDTLFPIGLLTKNPVTFMSMGITQGLTMGWLYAAPVAAVVAPYLGVKLYRKLFSEKENNIEKTFEAEKAAKGIFEVRDLTVFRTVLEENLNRID